MCFQAAGSEKHSEIEPLWTQVSRVWTQKPSDNCGMKPPSQPNTSVSQAQIDAFFRRGTALHQQGQLQQAWDIYRQILGIQPRHFDALHMAGLVAAQGNNNEVALQLIGNAIAVNPNSADAHGNRGNVFIQMGRFQEALDCFERLDQMRPGQAQTHVNRGNALKGLKEWDRALESYDRAIQLDPKLATAHSNRGAVLLEQHRYSGALESLATALKLQPTLAEAHFNTGMVYMQLARHQAAMEAFEKALPLLPNKAEALLHRGISLVNMGRQQEAIQDFDRVIAQNPNHDAAHAHRGIALYDAKRFTEAYESYAKAYSLNPDIAFLYGTMIRTKLSVCNWQDFESDYRELCERLSQREKVAAPHVVSGLIDSPSLQRGAAEVFVEHSFPANRELGELARKRGDERICVAYFSSDFRNHPVAYLTAELFELHDRNRFKLIAFSLGQSSNSEMRQRISAAFDQFIEVNGKSDKEVAQLSRELGVDIAVDLNGLTKGARTNIFAYRAAPVQVGYIGFLGTTGASYMDYIVADHTIIPDHMLTFYSEKVVYLPSYQANDSKSRQFDRKLSRGELGIADQSFVFCSFNSNYKITPTVFDSWMRILKACDNSVLLLSADNVEAKENLKREAIARGVDGERLIFGERLERPLYLARYEVADLFLDTWPYNAGTTASDALWAGLPILTLVGQSFASRIAASILTAIELPELIATTVEQYEALAIHYAKNSGELLDVKQKLAVKKSSARLFNTSQFTTAFESALTEMVHRYESGLEPDHIYVDA